MKFQFTLKYFVLAILLLLIEILIALYGTGVVRHFVGDILVVALLYCIIRSIYEPKKNTVLVIGIFIFAYTIEGLQLLNLPKLMGVEDNVVLSTILGNTYDRLDILAYGIGCVAVVILEASLTTRQ